MKKTIEVRVCDLHKGNTEAASTVRMSWNGKSYQLDLCDQHRSELDSAVSSWVTAVRPAKKSAPQRTKKATRAKRSTGPKRRAPRKSGGNASIAQMREWAQANGLDVKTRGRIPAEIRAAYRAAKR
jgi:Lsr2